MILLSALGFLFIVLSAYDLKLVMDKDQLDVIKPSWITDSIEAGEAVPLRKKYVSHFVSPTRDV